MKQAHVSETLTVSSITVGTVVGLVVAKSAAYVLSDSTSVLSSLVDSVSDIGLSAMTWMSIRWSLKPADEDHRYGHGKIEGVAALFQAAMLTGAAVFLLFSALGRLLQPQPIEDHISTVFLMTISAAASLFLTFIQRRASKKSGSLALEADQAHYATDVWMNGIVILVVLADYAKLSPHWLDSVATVGISGLFGHAAYKIVVKSLDMLLDREVPPEIKFAIQNDILADARVRGLHDLRCIRSGMRMLISFDIEIDSRLSLKAAHEIARDIEMKLIDAYPNSEILIHLDPEGDTADTRHGGAA